jgi:trans-aconitate 2-methyltransferase
VGRSADWDAAAYHRLAAPQEQWAREVLERLPLRGDETALDAGCGSGRATRLLLDRLPRGRVIGVDGSESMIAEARRSLAAYGKRIALVHDDLLDLELGKPVDALFSNATFHWIHDHDRLFRRLRAALKPGAPLAAQCGGEGNVAEFDAAIVRASARPEFAPFFAGWSSPYNFAGAAETERRLRAAGFERVRCWLERKDVQPLSPREFAAAAGLAPHRERLPAELRDPFVDAVLAQLEQPLVFRYVRLNIDARAGG